MQTPCKVLSTTSGIPGQSIHNIFVGGISTKPEILQAMEKVIQMDRDHFQKERERGKVNILPIP
jgi:hypothetical protein